MLEQNGLEDNPHQAISILAKYFYHHCGYRKKKIIRHLTSFLEKNYPRYKIQKQSWAATIEKIANKAGKYPLYEVDEILITQAELDTIDTAENHPAIANLDRVTINNIKRLSFTMLCLAKLGTAKSEKTNGWVNTRTRDLLQLSRINCSQKQGSFLISHMNAAGLLEFAKKNTNLSRRVTFINNNSKPVLLISDFRELGYAYLKYLGENIIECAQCGILIRGTANHSRRYCNECNGSKPMISKKIKCVDCGVIFTVPSKNNKTDRCPNCQNDRDRENARLRKQKQREIARNVTVTN